MIYYCIVLVLFGFVGSSPTKLDDMSIIGGQDVDIKQAPYQVALQFSNGQLLCGGSIVTNSVIITAAHCLQLIQKPEDLYIRAGSSIRNQGGELIQAKCTVIHPEYNKPSDLNNDGGIIWLTRALVFSDSIKPIPLANIGEEVPEGGMSFVSGWGQTANGTIPLTLQGIKIARKSDQYCTNLYNSDPNFPDFTSTMLCAASPGMSACHGDSGGPLVYDGKLAGIVSWGKPVDCANPKYPSVYVKVSALRGWFDKTIAQLSEEYGQGN